MQRRLRITVDGHAYTVTVEDLDESGGLFPAPPAALRQSAPPTPAPAAAAPAAAVAMVAPTGGEPGDVLATLGGMVESVKVSVGQTVAKGDTLVVLEAMKMNSPMVAPQSGTVSRVCVKAGDPVEVGHLLATVV